jgi:hypothetical protein
MRMELPEPMRNAAGRAGRLLTVGLSLVAASPASAQAVDKEQAAIRAALLKWTNEFNARDPSHICDLFAPDLV